MRLAYMETACWTDVGLGQDRLALLGAGLGWGAPRRLAATKARAWGEMKRSEVRGGIVGGQYVLTSRALSKTEYFGCAWNPLIGIYKVAFALPENVLPFKSRSRLSQLQELSL